MAYCSCVGVAFLFFIFFNKTIFDSVGFKIEIGSNVLAHVIVIFIQKQKSIY